MGRRNSGGVAVLIYCEPAVRAGGPVNEPASHTPSSHRARAATAGAVLALAIAVAVGWPPARSSGGQAPPRPNVIVVLTDDQTVAELTPETMPADDQARSPTTGTALQLEHRLEPALLSLARRLPHRPVPAQLRRLRQRARLRRPDRQGLDLYSLAAGRRLPHRPRRPLPAQLRPRAAAGRRSTTPTSASRAPAGVEDWFGYVGSADPLPRRHLLRQRHPGDRRAPAPPTTRPSVINRDALDFVRDAKADPRPFFLMVAHLAPHSSNTPAPASAAAARAGCRCPRTPRPIARIANVTLPKPPSFDESKIADKPDWVATRPPLGAHPAPGT